MAGYSPHRGSAGRGRALDEQGQKAPLHNAKNQYARQK